MNLKVLGKFIQWHKLLENHILVTRLEEENKCSELTWQVVEDISNFIDWEELSRHANLLTEKFLHNHAHRFDFDYVVRTRQLSMDFLRTNPRVLNKFGDSVCVFQNLTEQFIEEFIDMLDLNLVSKYQTLSVDFIRKHYKRLNMPYVKKYQHVPPSILYDLERLS